MFKKVRIFVLLIFTIHGCLAMEDAAKNQALRRAVREGNISTVENLLKEGVNVNSQDKRGRTPMHIAAKYGRAEVARILIKYKPFLHQPDKKGTGPLHVAASHGRDDVIRVLAAAHVWLDTQDNDGDTALHRALYKDNIHLALILIDLGANLETLNNNSRGPLDVASTDALAAIQNHVAKKMREQEARPVLEAWGYHSSRR